VDALLLLNVYYDSNFCPPFLETVSLLVPNRNPRYFVLFNVYRKHRNCSARCSSTSNAITGKSVFFNDLVN